MATEKPKTVTSWPPKPPVAQLTRADLRNMSPEAINEAREGGALDDLLKGAIPPKGGEQ